MKKSIFIVIAFIIIYIFTILFFSAKINHKNNVISKYELLQLVVNNIFHNNEIRVEKIEADTCLEWDNNIHYLYKNPQNKKSNYIIEIEMSKDNRFKKINFFRP